MMLLLMSFSCGCGDNDGGGGPVEVLEGVGRLGRDVRLEENVIRRGDPRELNGRVIDFGRSKDRSGGGQFATGRERGVNTLERVSTGRVERTNTGRKDSTGELPRREKPAPSAIPATDPLLRRNNVAGIPSIG